MSNNIWTEQGNKKMMTNDDYDAAEIILITIKIIIIIIYL